MFKYFLSQEKLYLRQKFLLELKLLYRMFSFHSHLCCPMSGALRLFTHRNGLIQQHLLQQVLCPQFASSVRFLSTVHIKSIRDRHQKVNSYNRLLSFSDLCFTTVRHSSEGIKNAHGQFGKLKDGYSSSSVGRKDRTECYYGSNIDSDTDSDSDEERGVSALQLCDRHSNQLLQTEEETYMELHKVTDFSLPEISRTSKNLAVFANRSETLQKLVLLGVDLSKVQEFDGIANLLLRSDFDRDVAPYVRFLVDIGVPADKVGEVLTINPLILTEQIQDLEERVGFLCHNSFSLQEVGSMFSQSPIVTLMTPKHLEHKLGFLQQTFQLSDEQLRKVAVKCPRILPYKEKRIALLRFTVKEIMGFNEKEMKEILIKCPQVYMLDTRQLNTVFDYIHNTMHIPHESVLVWPDVLLHDVQIIRMRHSFLISQGRNQFDPRLENYVSLEALVSSSDEEFCTQVSKSDVQEYFNFLKTM